MSSDIGYPEKVNPYYLWCKKNLKPIDAGYSINTDVIHYDYINNKPHEMYHLELHTVNSDSLDIINKEYVKRVLKDKKAPNYALYCFAVEERKIPWYFVFHTNTFTEFWVFKIDFIDRNNYNCDNVGRFSSDEFKQFLINLRKKFLEKKPNN
jgi:hypothetical protein